jgi:integrase
MALTAKRVLRARKKPGRYLDGHGLMLQVRGPTNASWLLRYQRDGRVRTLGLGPLHTVTLAEARARAKAARLQLLDGDDPLEEKRAAKAERTLEAARAVTFKECAERFYAAHEREWSNAKHRMQFLSTLRDYVHPIIGALPVASIDEPMVLKVLQPIWATKTVTARRVRNRIASVLDFASASKYRTGTNPARWEGHLEHLLATPEKLAPVKSHAALPYNEIAAFIADLRKVEGVAARALEFTILTAARTGETIGATWDEIDLDEATWIIPATRMKAGREHRVPLCDRAMQILRALPRETDNPHVFIGAKAGSGLSDIVMFRTLKELRPDVTVHGFRSSFSTWSHETTAYPAHVIEISLAHSIGTAVERAYRRGDLFEKRRRLMTDWGKHCATPVKKQAAGAKVVALRGKRGAA